jgi:hypothetical protein
MRVGYASELYSAGARQLLTSRGGLRCRAPQADIAASLALSLDKASRETSLG